MEVDWEGLGSKNLKIEKEMTRRVSDTVNSSPKISGFRHYGNHFFFECNEASALKNHFFTNGILVHELKDGVKITPSLTFNKKQEDLLIHALKSFR